MQPETIVDYMQIDIDGVITVETVELPDGITAGDHVVVGDHADLIGHSSPTLTS